jgi:hypothetical protein
MAGRPDEGRIHDKVHDKVPGLRNPRFPFLPGYRARIRGKRGLTDEGGEHVLHFIVDLSGIGEGIGDGSAEGFPVALAPAIDRDGDGLGAEGEDGADGSVFAVDRFAGEKGVEEFEVLEFIGGAGGFAEAVQGFG